jgi:hypothetical protein
MSQNAPRPGRPPTSPDSDRAVSGCDHPWWHPERIFRRKEFVKGRALQAELARQLETHPAATLAEHCRIWETEHGMQVSSATMSRRSMLKAGYEPFTL